MIHINIDLFIYFIIYSVLGWFGEVGYCYLLTKKFTNRGFYYSPIVPLYGFGALLVYLLLSPFKDNIIIFFILSIFVTSTLEYFTALLMENLFHIKWWDYSNYKFNIKGRVCLLNSTLFGIGSVIFMYIIHPFISSYVMLIPYTTKNIIVDLFLVVLIVDLYFTLLKLDKVMDRDIHVLSGITKNIQTLEDKFKNIELNSSKNFLYLSLLLAIAIGTFSIVVFDSQLALSLIILVVLYAYVQRRNIKKKGKKNEKK